MLQILLDTNWEFDTKFTLYSSKKMGVLNTRFTKCSLTNLPIAEKAKNQKTRTKLYKLTKNLMPGISAKIHQILIQNTCSCKNITRSIKLKEKGSKKGERGVHN